MGDKIGVLFVCAANICRSPMAEAVFRHKASRTGLLEHLLIDSAATHDFRVGEPPDANAQQAAGQRGYAMTALRSRQISRADLEHFDHVLAMDMKNMTALHRLGEPDLWQKPKLLMSFSRLYREREITDPYGLDLERFELALDMIESATEGLLAAIRDELRLRGER